MQKANIRKPLTKPLCTEKPFTGRYNSNAYLNIETEGNAAMFIYASGSAILENIVTMDSVTGRWVAGIVVCSLPYTNPDL